jgi:hypothetical protein
MKEFLDQLSNCQLLRGDQISFSQLKDKNFGAEPVSL